MRNSPRTKADWDRLVAQNKRLLDAVASMEFTGSLLMVELADLEQHVQALDSDLAQWVRLAKHQVMALPDGHPLRPMEHGIKASENLLGRTIRGPEPKTNT